jgi:transposase-like protein
MTSEFSEPIERWTAKRRVSLVVSILKGETSVAEAARTHGLTVAEVEDWREKFLLGAENALRSRPKDEEAVKEEQIKKLKQKIGDLVLDNDILREALKPYPWTGRHPTRESGAAGRLGTTELSGAECQPSRAAPDGSGIGETPGGRSAVGRAAAAAHSAASHLWLSTAVGAAAIPRRDPRESQGRLPGAEAEPVVRASTCRHPAPSCAGLGESGESEQ